MFKDKLTNNKFIVSLLINLTFLFLALLFCDMKYEVSDDFIMDAILSGALGHNYNEHLLFSNILYGYLLKFLYSITEKISWYFVFQVVICFVSLTSLCYIVLKRNNSLIGLIFCLIFVSFFSDDLYILVQFTKTATVATCAGGSMFFICYFLFRKKAKTYDNRCTINNSWVNDPFSMYLYCTCFSFYSIYKVCFYYQGIQYSFFY